MCVALIMLKIVVGNSMRQDQEYKSFEQYNLKQRDFIFKVLADE